MGEGLEIRYDDNDDEFQGSLIALNGYLLVRCGCVGAARLLCGVLH